jgi:HlyD family secretion protein
MGAKKYMSILVVIILIGTAAIATFYFLNQNAPDNNARGGIQTEKIGKGEVVLSTKASGVVESENEVLILSPATSIVKSILKEPGNPVAAGEIILQLQTQPVEDEIERLTDQLEIKKNNLEKTRLNSQSTKLDLDYSEEVKRLKIISLKAQLSDQEQLLEVGGISPARVEETKQEITLAEKDFSTMAGKNTIRLKQLEADEAGLLLQINVDEKLVAEKMKLLSKMNVRAPSSGVILNIIANVGEKVPADKLLVQLSDRSSFKISGSIDEKLANQIKTGTKVFVLIEKNKLEGTVGSVTPLVANQKINFNVHLTESNHPKLIANQSVLIEIISSKKENVLRIRKQEGFESAKTCKVYVVDGDRAVRRKITLGMVGDDYCEVVSGLNEGDEVVTGDTKTTEDQEIIEIEN